jgi:hypothetical protein
VLGIGKFVASDGAMKFETF